VTPTSGRSPLVVSPALTIAADELEYTFTRSGGPGGQNVNKVATRVTVRFNVDASPSLSDEQRQRLRAGLATRISQSGTLQVSAQRERSQSANRALARTRLAELLAEALRPVKSRRIGRVPRGASQRRLAEKRAQAERKRERRADRDD
jgi:ribosome-associated protein